MFVDPALAQAMASAAMPSIVYGKWGVWVGTVIAPVSAVVRMSFSIGCSFKNSFGGEIL
jgi:ABC-type phosphate transport system permease subunit